MAKITSNNIVSGIISSNKLDSYIINTLNSASSAQLAYDQANAAFDSANTTALALENGSSSLLITNVQIADASYNILDDTAVSNTGGFVVITGSGFTSQSTVVFGTISSPAVTFVDSTTLRAQTPVLPSASYPVYVVNIDGSVAIRLNALTVSPIPVWGTAATLTSKTVNTFFTVSLSATSDSSITYSNTTTLPEGTSLLANGYFFGTVTTPPEATYTFDVKATDVQLQDADRTFNITITVDFLYSAGWNQYGNLGHGGVINRSSPVQIGTANWKEVSASLTHTLAIAKDDTLWGWGDGRFNALDAANIPRSSPTQINAGPWKTVAAGNRISAGIKSNGTLWTWGQGTYGAMGTNNQTNRTLTQLGALTNWNLVACSKYGMVASRTDGTLWTWGRNQGGQIGDNTRLDRSSPIQIGGTTWLKPTAGYQHTVVTKTDGTAWGWGNGSGFSSLTFRSSPVQIGAGITWSTVSSHSEGNHLLAIDSLGRAWAGGSGSFGSTGLNNTASNQNIGSNQIAGTWLSMSAGSYGGLGVKSAGTLWAWGTNARGSVGNNTVITASSPVQIGSDTNWKSVFGGNQAIFATKGS